MWSHDLAGMTDAELARRAEKRLRLGKRLRRVMSFCAGALAIAGFVGGAGMAVLLGPGIEAFMCGAAAIAIGVVGGTQTCEIGDALSDRLIRNADRYTEEIKRRAREKAKREQPVSAPVLESIVVALREGVSAQVKVGRPIRFNAASGKPATTSLAARLRSRITGRQTSGPR